jgi:hypothetical protein
MEGVGRGDWWAGIFLKQNVMVLLPRDTTEGFRFFFPPLYSACHRRFKIVATTIWSGMKKSTVICTLNVKNRGKQMSSHAPGKAGVLCTQNAPSKKYTRQKMAGVALGYCGVKYSRRRVAAKEGLRNGNLEYTHACIHIIHVHVIIYTHTFTHITLYKYI